MPGGFALVAVEDVFRAAIAEGALVDRQGDHWIAIGDHLVRWRPDPLPTDVQESSQTPTAYRLDQNHPNPFNAETTIAFHLARRQRLSLTVFNLAGQAVRTLMAGDFGPGPYRARWDGRNDSGQPTGSGLYFYRLQTQDHNFIRKMLLLK